MQGREREDGDERGHDDDDSILERKEKSGEGRDRRRRSKTRGRRDGRKRDGMGGDGMGRKAVQESLLTPAFSSIRM